MGTVINGLTGNYNGKIGNLVFYILNGKQVVRTIGKSTSPPTVAQLKCRLEIKLINTFLKPVTEFINIGFKLKSRETNKGAYNLALSYNKKHALQYIFPEMVMAYEMVLLTQGNLTGAILPEAEQIPGGLKFNWNCPDNLCWPDTNDQAMLLAYFPKLNKAIYILYGAKRAQCEAILNIPPELSAEYMEVYISFIAEDRNKISNSSYLRNFNK